MDKERFDAATDVIYLAYCDADNDLDHAYSVACNTLRAAAAFQIEQYQEQLDGTKRLMQNSPAARPHAPSMQLSGLRAGKHLASA
jgi:hypothetical protein